MLIYNNFWYVYYVDMWVLWSSNSSKIASLINIEQCFMQHPDTPSQSCLNLATYSCSICIFRLFAYCPGNINFQWRTSSFSPHSDTDKMNHYFKLFAGVKWFIYFYMEISHLVTALFCPHKFVGLHGLRAGWVQSTACKASLLLGVGFYATGCG